MLEAQQAQAPMDVEVTTSAPDGDEPGQEGQQEPPTSALVWIGKTC